jgi:hypothetical protein
VTNLVILHHDIEQAALIVEDKSQFDRLFPLDNIRGGFRYCRVISEVLSSSTLDIVFTLGTNDTRPASYIYIPLLHKSTTETWGGSLALAHSDDGSSWTTVFTEASINEAATYGRDEVDYFRSFTTTAAKQYWRLRFSGATVGRRINIGAIFLGTPLDLLGDWNNWDTKAVDNNNPSYADSGTLHFAKAGELKRSIRAEWDGISESLARQFELKVARNKASNSFILYATTHDFVVDCKNFVQCRLDTCEIAPSSTQDWIRIIANFVEE